jgi:hypothetical protein
LEIVERPCGGVALDQLPLWLSRQYVKVPLSPESVRKSFEFSVELRPEK